MSPDITPLLLDVFPDEAHAGIRHRCFLALKMGYSVAILGNWITMGKPYDTRAAWTAENVPRLIELDKRLQG